MEVKNLAAVENNHANMAVTSGFATMEGFQLLQRISNMFAKSSLVPKNFQGNLPDCAIAVNMAQRLNADPLMVMHRAGRADITGSRSAESGWPKFWSPTSL